MPAGKGVQACLQKRWWRLIGISSIHGLMLMEPNMTQEAVQREKFPVSRTRATQKSKAHVLDTQLSHANIAANMF